MREYISFSGGVESTTMCILYGKNAKGLFSDTGSEHKKMYERIELVEDKIKQIHPNFEIIKIKPDVKAKGVKTPTLEDYCIESKVMPSHQMRFCTRKFKIEPIDNYLRSQPDNCRTIMIGLNFDEQNSREGNWGLDKSITYKYPLIDDGYSREDCEEILNQYGLHPNMPVYMSRGGCRMCFFKSPKEYKAMYHLQKDEYMEVMDFEEQIQDKRKKFYSIMGNGKSLRQLAIECEREKDFLCDADWDELYKSLRKETSCGAFCHR